MSIYLILFIIIAVNTSDSNIKITKSINQIKFGNRLPNNTKPISYDLHVETDLNLSSPKYNGVVVITLEICQNTNEIILHAHEGIEIFGIILVDQENGFEYENLNYTQNSMNDFLKIFSLLEPLELENGRIYLLKISFQSDLSVDMFGFYSSNYGNQNGKIFPIASTFFEPIFARQAFPCYDEPALKAKFSISITHNPNFPALSNMPVDGEPSLRSDGMITTKFKESPPMSTYTVAFVIGNYIKTSRQINNNLTLNVYTLDRDKDLIEFHLSAAEEILITLQDYFDLPFSLPKLDHIYVPQLYADAMENWGLIVYSKENSDFLKYIYNKYPNYSRLQRYFLIAHETIHQWFGNLITPKWWNHIWLSEAMTNFYSSKILNILHPEWNHEEYLFAEKCDEFENWYDLESRSMSQYTENPSEIINLLKFNCKGIRIMRMFDYALTNKTLKKGMQKFLKKYQYSNADENDLFDCLQEAATEDHIPEFEKPDTVKKIMSTWTQLKNYPRISIKRNYTDGTFYIRQDTISVKNDTKAELWWIPITIVTASNPNFDNTTIDLVFPNISKILVDPSKFNKTLLNHDWLLINKNRIGPYQIQYDERNWNLIIDALKKDPKIIPNWNKVQLIRDAGYLEDKFLLSSKILYDLLTYLENEIEVLPWIEGLRVMKRIQDKLYKNGGVEFFHYFARNIIKNIANVIGEDVKSTDNALVEIFREDLKNFAFNIQYEFH